MRTTEAVTQAPGVWQVFAVTLAIYFVIGIGTIVILRQLARQPLPENPYGA
jgi:cytochrome bd ubiquinol oxidase subunit I